MRGRRWRGCPGWPDQHAHARRDEHTDATELASIEFDPGDAPGYGSKPTTLPTIQGGYNATLTFPGSLAPAGQVTLGLSTTLPSGAPTVQSRRISQIISGNPTALVFLTLNSSSPISFITGPTISFQLPTTPSAGTTFGLALYDPTNPAAGWQLSATAYASGTTVSFLPGAALSTYAAVNTYVYALVSSASLPTPPSPLTGPGILEVAFPNTNQSFNVNSSAIVTVNGTPLPVSRIFEYGAGSGGLVYATQLQAQSVQNATISVEVFGTIDGTGPPIAFGSGTGTIYAAQTSVISAPLNPVMSSFSVTLNPSIVVTGTARDVGIVLTPSGTGGIYSGTWVDNNNTSVTFAASVADSTGQTAITLQPTLAQPGTLHYSGTGKGPAIVSATSGSLHASAQLNYAQRQDIFALGTFICGPHCIGNNSTIAYYDAGGAVPVWSNSGPVGYNGGNIAFDQNGNLWVTGLSGYAGYAPSGATIGTIALTDTLMTFDTSGLMYTASGNQVHVYSLSGVTPTLVRSILLNEPAATVAVTSSGTIFVEGMQPTPVIYEYPPGASSPSTFTLNNVGPVAVDAAGDLFVALPTSISKWPVGTPITSTPTTVLPEPSNAPGFIGMAVTPGGNGCALSYQYLSFGSFLSALNGWNAGGASATECPQGPTYGTLASPIR